MRKIIEKNHHCCGCSACLNVCPKSCIEMQEDEEGFCYPHINESICIDCGLCKKTCPVNSEPIPREPIKVLAAQNRNIKYRIKSSSGGIFYLLAERVINENGFVFGAAINEYGEVRHVCVDKMSLLDSIIGSKYVQSDIGNSYALVKSLLIKGKLVLFSGTPCQISGLIKFLNHTYDNLLLVDIICHGVPSPGVFRWYLSEGIQNLLYKAGILPKSDIKMITRIPPQNIIDQFKGVNVSNVSFRDKRKGWKNFSLQFTVAALNGNETRTMKYSKTKRKDPFLRGFLSNLYLRPSCHDCRFRNLSSGSDITLGDFWNIGKTLPDYDDNKGTSVVLINSKKGNEIINSLNMRQKEIPYSSLCKKGSAICVSPIPSSRRSVFFSSNNYSFSELIDANVTTSIKKRIIWSIYDFMGAGYFFHKFRFVFKKYPL